MNLNKDNFLLTSRNYKNLKINYQNNILLNNFSNTNFLIFYYDFLDLKTKKILKNLLIENQWKMYRIKKNTALQLFTNPLYFPLKNIFINNTFIITFDKNQKFTKNHLKLFLNFKNIFLLGSWFNNKLYRPSEFTTLVSLSENFKKNTFFLLKNTLKNILICLNFKIKNNK